MQAQRKFQEPAPAARVHWNAPETDDGWSPRLADFAPGHTPSPAHLLWDELAARLQQSPDPMPAAAVAPAAAKWPMPVRLGTIAVLSVAAWSAVYWAAVAII